MGADGRQLPCLGRSPLALRLPVHPQGAEVIKRVDDKGFGNETEEHEYRAGGYGHIV